MSFEFSPEAVLFSVKEEIAELQIKILGFQDGFVEVPEREFEIQEFFDRVAAVTRTREVTTNQQEINQASEINNSISRNIGPLQTRLNDLIEKIPILEKEIEVRTDFRIEANDAISQNADTSIIDNFNLSIKNLTENLQNIKVPVLNPDFPKPGQTDEKSNLPIIAAALIVGALIL